jgi:hypothetical protein
VFPGLASCLVDPATFARPRPPRVFFTDHKKEQDLFHIFIFLAPLPCGDRKSPTSPPSYETFDSQRLRRPRSLSAGYLNWTPDRLRPVTAHPFVARQPGSERLSCESLIQSKPPARLATADTRLERSFPPPFRPYLDLHRRQRVHQQPWRGFSSGCTTGCCGRFGESDRHAPPPRRRAAGHYRAASRRQRIAANAWDRGANSMQGDRDGCDHDWIAECWQDVPSPGDFGE